MQRTAFLTSLAAASLAAPATAQTGRTALRIGLIPSDFSGQAYFAKELGQQGVKVLQEKGALQGNQFLRLKERPPEIDPALYARMRRIASLGELKGMGLENALALEKLGIKRVEELARQSPEGLFPQLRALDQNVRLEEVKIWIREAKRQHGRNE